MPLKNILYISIPENFTLNIKDFNFDPSLLLPVEVRDPQNFTAEDLNWEDVISAILKIAVYEPSHKNFSYYKKLIFTLSPKLIEILLKVGIERAEAGDFNRAEEIFLSINSLYSGNDFALQNLALLYERKFLNLLKLDQEREALVYKDKVLKIYEKLLLLDNIQENVYLNSGLFFLNHYSIEKAINSLNEYVRVSKNKKLKNKVLTILDEIKSSLNLEDALKEIYDLIILAKESEAIEKSLKLIKVNNKSWNLWFLLGWAYRRVEIYERAKDAFLKVIKLNPKSIDALNELAICNMEENNFKLAEHYLQKALEIEHSNVKILSNLGILYFKQKRLEEAEKHFLITLEFEKDDPIARKYLESIKNSSLN